MKLVIFLTVALTLHAVAESKAQKITLNVKNIPLGDVMRELQEQQGYSFLFHGNHIAGIRVDAQLRQMEFADAMDMILTDLGLDWSLEDGIVTITRRPSLPIASRPMPQQRTVTGTVTDAEGNSLEGVTVRIKGEGTATSTDADGGYQIRIPEGPDVLTYSLMGFKPAESIIAGRSVINISLNTAVSDLDEVVVVGYGEQRRRDVTGSVVSIRPDDFQDMPQTNILQLLQGKLPGLNITNTGSTAEGDVSMRIRARNSINADAPPLIILDGIQYDGFLSELNPNDIESIEVLKDASSAAIYGARAANGVLLITTKTGKAGERRISFDSNVGFSDLVNIPKMMDASQYYQFKQQRMGYVAVFEENNHQDGVNTNWLDMAMRTGVRQEYNLSVAGGNENTTYFISGSGVFVDGNAINDTYNRYTVRLNMETKVNPWIRFGTHTSLGYFDRPGDAANLNTAMQMNPLTRPYNDAGQLNYRPNPDDLSMVNPLEPLNYTKEDVARGAITNNYLHVDAPFLEGLSYRLLTGFNFRNRLIEQYKSSTNTLSGSQVGGEANLNNQYKQDWSIENIVNYQKDFGLHAVHLTGVYSARKYVTKYHNIHGVGFPDDIRSYYQFKDAAALTASDTYTQESSLSQMLRINYNYAGKYLLTATVRRDGFSAFGSNNKYGIFPSIAIGWNMQSEPFFENFAALNSSKLRLSYGENGNQAIQPYAAMPSMSSQYYLDEGGNTLVGFYPNKLADPSLSWETTRQINAGWDFSWFNGRLFGSVDYFYANTFDLLLSKNIPQINGVQSIRQNVGRTRSSGVELAITTANVQKENFTWQTRFNFSHNKNRIIDVGLFDEAGNPVDNLGSRWFIGEPISVIYAYQFDGIWQETDDLLNSHMPTAKPGDIRVLDYDNDNQITTDDRHIIGYQDPDFRAGLINTLSYKGVTLTIFLNAVYGGMRWTEYMNTYFEKHNIRQRDWWTPDNPINTYPENRDDSNPYQVAYFGKANDASFLRLSDISLGYALPEPMLRKIGVHQLEVFGNVKNVATITNYMGLDPEFTSDFGTPLARTFILGIRLGL